MLPTASRQIAASLSRRYVMIPSRFKAKKEWPPDFTKLTPKQQFRLERKFKRRAALKWARPRWIKGVTIAQWGSVTFALIYGVLFMDWGTEDTPFRSVREWVKREVKNWAI